MYLGIEGVSTLLFYMYGSLSALYRIKSAGLNPLQLVLLGTALEGATLLCEIPTGVIADVYSRRLSVILGFLIEGAGFVLEGAIPYFATILLAQVVWGVGYTFTSGALEAWITGEVGEERVGPIFLRGAQLGQLGGLAGIAGAAVLASIRLNLPIVVAGALIMALGVALIFVMPEQGFQRTRADERASWRAMGVTLRRGGGLVRRHPALLAVFAAVAFYGMSSEGVDRLWEAHLLKNFTFPGGAHLTPVIWFAKIDAAGVLLGIGATEVARRRLNLRDHYALIWTLLAINALLIVSLVGLGLARGFAVAVAAYLLMSLLRRTRNPIYSAWLAQNTEPATRATVMSMSSQMDALGQIAGGPVVGVIGTLAGLRAAMVFSGAVLTPSLLFFGRVLRPSKRSTAQGPNDGLD